MLRTRLICMVIALCVIMTAFATPTSADGISAKAAVMLEYSTNTVLYSSNAHTKLPMASTTKVMTAIIAIEMGKLDEIVTTADCAYGVEGSSIYLNKNERISLRDLLYGLMLRSGNDAAVAIACHIGGSVDGFVDLMNKKAKQIGAMNTNFKNPNGLPDDEHYTTAYDLCLICSYCLKNETFKTIVSSQYYTAESGEVKRTMMNKNKLLWQYEGTIGIKTGYTKKAGKCLTFATERDGMTVVGVVLDCPNMFPDSIKLMDWCYDNYEMYNVVKKGTVVARCQPNNSNSLATLIAQTDIYVPVRKSAGIKLFVNVKINDNLTAPLSEGDKTGTLELYCDNRLISTTPLVSKADVKPKSVYYYFNRIISQMVK